MNRFAPHLLAILLCLLAPTAPAQTMMQVQASAATQPVTTAPSAEIKLQLTTEEGKKQIQATVTAGGKPVEGATVAFFVQRSFGKLQIGKDTTLDDGTAATAFPTDLPGGQSGQLQVMAIVQAPTKYAQAATYATFGGAAVVHPWEDAFPRALWAPRAPWLLLVTLFGSVAVVWCVYAYVVAQLWALYRGR
jgi:hypothetical protein